MFGIWIGAQLAVLVLVIPIFIAGVDNGVLDPQMQSIIIFASVLVSSVCVIAMVAIWSRSKENKSLLDIGIRLDSIGWQQYRTGLVTGALFGLAMMFLIMFLQYGLQIGTDVEIPEDAVFQYERLLRPGFLLLIAAIAVLFAIQGASEEVLCRGWLLSGLAARKNLRFAVLLSSFLFASLHVHYFFIEGFSISQHQVLTGVFGIGTMFAMGLMLAMIAMRDRSIMGSSGLHSAFNFFAISTGVVLNVLTSEDGDPVNAFAQSLDQSTKLQGITPALLVEFILAALVAWFLYRKFGLPKPQTNIAGRKAP
jgi:membrane protease YdiL (CAAX protease family)